MGYQAKFFLALSDNPNLSDYLKILTIKVPSTQRTNLVFNIILSRVASECQGISIDKRLRAWLWNESDLVLNPAPSLIHCVILGKF